jgi:hypothetical protein
MADTVYVEQTKLLANALDRASTASLTVGVLAPVAGAFLSLSGPNSPDLAQFIWCVVAYFLVSYVFHRLAMRVLRGLNE